MKRIGIAVLGMMLLLSTPMWAQDSEIRQKYTGHPISLDFQDAPVRQILQLIADVSGHNLVIGQAVEGNVTLRLKRVPWDQALAIVLTSQGLGMVKENNIIRVNTLTNLARQRDEESRVKATKIRAEDLVTRIVQIHYNNAKDMATTISSGSSGGTTGGRGGARFLTERGQISADKRTNSLIIRDTESVINQIVALIRDLDRPTPQVVIEARIVQVRPVFSRNLGVQWGGRFTNFGNESTFNLQGNNLGDLAVNLPAANAVGGVGMTFGRLLGSPFSLDLRLSAGESQGLTKIVSTPKVTVLDNQTAKIQQGESIPFETVSQEGTQTVFHDANLSLEVTPHITGDGKVSMYIKVAKNLPGESRSAAGPSILRREANTNVLLQDGETTVIGGIFERTQVDSTQRVPYLSKIPFLGWLFKSTSKRDDTEELLVFITPRIVK